MVFAAVPMTSGVRRLRSLRTQLLDRARREAPSSPLKPLDGTWQLYNRETPPEQHQEKKQQDVESDASSSKRSHGSAAELLSAAVQEISCQGDRLVFSSHGSRDRLVLELNGENENIRCVVPDGACEDGSSPVRFEYETPQGKVIDERRVFRNGARLEQKLSMQPRDAQEAPTVERRYFKRKLRTSASTTSLMERQKVRLLGYLLLSQIPLLLLVPSRLWGSFIAAFHTVALFLILFWSPAKAAAAKRNPSSSLQQREGQQSQFHQKAMVHEEPEEEVAATRRKSRSSSKPKANVMTSSASSTIVEKIVQIPDVSVRVGQLKKKKTGLTSWSTEVEFLVQTRKDVDSSAAFKFKEWKVSHKLASIIEFHKLVQDLAESGNRKIPPLRFRGSRISGFKKSHLREKMQKKREILEAFTDMVFGESSEDTVRFLALRDERVQRFLRIV